jgi:hypothetical protein
VFRTWVAQASCECGWWGRQRLLCGQAVYDAHVHCAETACVPATDLLIDFRSTVQYPAADFRRQLENGSAARRRGASQDDDVPTSLR